MRILAIDPGDKNIGLAISDPTAMIASPLAVLQHTSRMEDAQAVIRLAQINEVGLIIVGESLDDEGVPTPQSRKSSRFAAAIQQLCEIPVIRWDEALSTNDARQRRLEMGAGRKKRRGHQDDLAAAVMLQSYLDAHSQ